MSVGELAQLSGDDQALVGADIRAHEFGDHNTLWIADKWSEEACEYVRRQLGLEPEAGVSSALLRDLVGAPDIGTEEIEGNLLLNEGIQAMLDLLIGAGGTAFNNANARTGVGDSSTAEAATQTDLQAGANKLYKAMNASYPSRANQTLSFQSDFLTGEANYAWQEWTIDNGGAALKNLNRKVQSLGTKVTGTWTLTTTITFS